MQSVLVEGYQKHWQEENHYFFKMNDISGGGWSKGGGGKEEQTLEVLRTLENQIFTLCKCMICEENVDYFFPFSTI